MRTPERVFAWEQAGLYGLVVERGGRRLPILNAAGYPESFRGRTPEFRHMVDVMTDPVSRLKLVNPAPAPGGETIVGLDFGEPGGDRTVWGES